MSQKVNSDLDLAPFSNVFSSSAFSERLPLLVFPELKMFYEYNDEKAVYFLGGHYRADFFPFLDVVIENRDKRTNYVNNETFQGMFERLQKIIESV